MTNGVHLGHRGKGLLVVNFVSLGVFPGNQSNFVLVNYSI